MSSKTTKTALGLLISIALIAAAIVFIGLSINNTNKNVPDDNDMTAPTTSEKGTIYYDYSITKANYILLLTSTKTADPGFTFLVVKLTIKNATDSSIKLQTTAFKITDGNETYSYNNTDSFYQNYHYTWAPEMKTISSVNLAKDTSYTYYLVYEVPSQGSYSLEATDTYRYSFEYDPTLN